MFKLRHKLYELMNMMKGCCAGYSTKYPNKMMIDNDGERYMVEFTKIENPNEDMHKDMKKYF